MNPLTLPKQVDVLETADCGAVPVIAPRFFDERQVCTPVLLYLAGENEGRPTDYTACPSYKGGTCGRCGPRVPCAFLEPESAPVWAKAATWRLLQLPDGATAATPARSAAETAADLGAVIIGAEVVKHELLRRTV